MRNGQLRLKPQNLLLGLTLAPKVCSVRTYFYRPNTMEATVAERGQITLSKAVRDALSLTKGTQLKVELDRSRIILRKNVDDAVSRLRGRFKLPEGLTTDDILRELRSRAPGDPVEP